MRISNSDISMSSNHSLVQKHEKEESLRMWIGNERPDFERRNHASRLTHVIQKDLVSLSDKARHMQKTKEKDKDKVHADGDFVLKNIVESMIKTLTGKKLKIKTLSTSEEKIESPDIKQNTAEPHHAEEKQGWGLEYDYHESYLEKESMQFEAGGTVTTKDGREINFNVTIMMSREFMMQQDISIRAGDAKKIDPIVVNFDGTAAELTDTKFSFDLDSDGTGDNISFVQAGNGFLALDINNDGVINNGSELFGPNTGDGFLELSKYDEDGNKWIDEADSVYNQLRIWTKDAEGIDSLYTLTDKNIGAIYLGNLSTPFSIKDSQNESLGEVKSTGIFLNENGSAGTIQQVDLII